MDGIEGYATVDEANTMEQWYIDHMASFAQYPRGKLLSCIGQSWVLLHPDGFACGASSPTGHCHGLERDNYLDVGAESTCLYRSTFLHELMHWEQWCVNNVYDPNHLELGVWGVADGFPSSCGT